MNELLKDCVSPELQDYFDYVKVLQSRLAAAREGLEEIRDQDPLASANVVAERTLERMK